MSLFVCPPESKQRIEIDTPLAVGFGTVSVSKGTLIVWEGDDERVTLEGFDAAASFLTEDGIPWRVVFNGPLVKETYKRIGQEGPMNFGIWELEAREDGFA